MIDYSNGYPVQVTTNISSKTPWKEVFKKNISLKNALFNWKDDGWRPSNWENIQKDHHCEDYKNVFVKLKTGCSCGHIHDNSYFQSLERFEKIYNQDKELRKKIDRYLEITNMNYQSMKKGGWRNPLGDLKAYGPKLCGLNPFCHYEYTELGKEYNKLEFELKEIFSKI